MMTHLICTGTERSLCPIAASSFVTVLDDLTSARQESTFVWVCGGNLFTGIRNQDKFDLSQREREPRSGARMAECQLLQSINAPGLRHSRCVDSSELAYSLFSPQF